MKQLPALVGFLLAAILTVVGVALVSAAAAFVVAGASVAGLTALFLLEVGR